MTIIEIENYLSNRNLILDEEIYNIIDNLRLNAISEKNEDEANYLWCLRQIFIIQKNFLFAFRSLQNEEYKNAWLSFDSADIELGMLENNFDITQNEDKYHLGFIERIIKKYQRLFPYHLFLSRESIIKKEQCSICKQEIRIRDKCNHKVGKLYMGELCLREVVDFEFKAFCIVTDPFDKYSVLEIKYMDYNYEVLKWLLKNIENPYDDFSFEETKVKNPLYKNIGRNELCPCGSGKKYKKCNWNTPDEMMDHFIFTFYNNKKAKPEPIKFLTL